MPHGSFGTVDFFQYGPFQLVTPGRRRDQRLQAFLRRRIAADLELVEVERLADLADLDLRGVGLGLLALADEVAADDAEHDADQHEHDEDFDQRHAARCAAAVRDDRSCSVRVALVALFDASARVDGDAFV